MASDPDGATHAPEQELVAAVLERPDAPDRCTLYPRGLPEHVQNGRWLAAESGAFVGLDKVR